MFDKNKFAIILKEIKEGYENQTQFAEKAGVNRTYLSQYMNLKLNSPPSPKILQGIADASLGKTTYAELMKLCGFIDVVDSFFDSSIRNDGNFFPIVDKIEFKDNLFYADCFGKSIELDYLNSEDNCFAYVISDKSMFPLLDIDDIAIIKKQFEFKSGDTCLLLFNDNVIIRKIIEQKDSNEILLQAMNPCVPVEKVTKEDFSSDNIKIIGRVIKAENQSAFK